METSSSFDAESLSDLIEQRLAETNRKDQAAAFMQLGILRLLLDMIGKVTNPRQEIPLAEIAHLLRQGSHRDSLDLMRSRTGNSRDADVFLALLDSTHRALVCDFDSLVDRIGEVSVVLQDLMMSESAPPRTIFQRYCTAWPGDDTLLWPMTRRVPLEGSLDDLKPVVGELSAAYRHPDFSKTRLRPKDFLR